MTKIERAEGLTTLPVYREERVDLVRKLELSGYGMVREPALSTREEVAKLASVAIITFLLAVGLAIV